MHGGPYTQIGKEVLRDGPEKLMEIGFKNGPTKDHVPLNRPNNIVG